MPALPLLKLPFLVQDLIIKCLALLEIFELSTTSKRAVNVIRQVKTKMSSISYTFLPDTRCSVTIGRAHETLYLGTNYLRYPENVQHRQIDGSRVQLLEFKQTSEHDKQFVFNADMRGAKAELKLIEMITAHLLKFMKFESTRLQFGKQQFDLKDLFVWKCTQRFDQVQITHEAQSPLRITSEELSFILEQVQTNQLSVYASISDIPDFKYQYSLPGPSEIQKLSIEHSSWVDPESLLKMDIKKIDFKIYRDCDNIINLALKGWITGENEKLEELKIYTDRIGRLNLEAMFAGTAATPTVFTDDELWTRRQISSDTTKDIRREKDGQKATVFNCSFVVTMIVWKDEHLRAIGKL